MKENMNQFLTNRVDIFEKFLQILWKNKIEIRNKKIYPLEKNLFQVDFELFDQKMIHMEIRIELNREKRVEKIGISYRQKTLELEEQLLALSFLYHCPYNLELCNQYGLYRKEDVEKMESEKDEKRLRKYQKEKDQLKNSQFYIFNMERIRDGCQDEELYHILCELDHFCMEWNELFH